MSFTTDIKSELCHVPVTDDTVLAEMLGMLAVFPGEFAHPVRNASGAPPGAEYAQPVFRHLA